MRLGKIFFRWMVAAAATLPVLASPPAQDTAPSRPIPARPLLFAAETPAPCAALVGFDIELESGLVPADISRLAEGTRPCFRLYWRPRGRTPENFHVRIEIAGAGSARRMDFPVPTETWELGGIYTGDYELPLWRMWSSGAATLRFTLPPAPEGKEPGPVLAAIPFHIAPAPAPSLLEDERVFEVFGKDAIRLDTRFRLGPEARLRLSPPNSGETRIAGLGVVSSIGWTGRVPDGATVCKIEVRPDGGSTAEELALVSGSSTHHMEIDRYAPRALEQGRIQVFEETPLDKKDQDGRALFKRSYTGKLLFPRPLLIESVSFRYTQPEGQIQIGEVVLLPANGETK